MTFDEKRWRARWDDLFQWDSSDSMLSALALAREVHETTVKEERERCAKVAEGFKTGLIPDVDGEGQLTNNVQTMTAAKIASAIRKEI